MYLWYTEERFRENDSSNFEKLQLVSSEVNKCIQLFFQGRSIGTTGISKILCDITPLKFINKINPQMALLCSLILSVTKKLDENFKVFKLCHELESLVKKLVKQIQFGKSLHKYLAKISNQIQRYIINKDYKYGFLKVFFPNLQQ